MKASAALIAIPVLAAIAFSNVISAKTGTTVATSESPFAGRPIVVEKKGVYFGVSEHARFETVGTSSFVVIKIQQVDGVA